MSLLMDALRKAEEAKRNQALATPEVEVTPEASAPPESSAIAEANPALSLEPLSTAEPDSPTAEPPPPPAAAEPRLPPPRPSPRVAPATERAQRETINNVFAAKQPARGNRAFALALAGLGGLALIGMAAYVWWQLQPRSNLGATPQLATNLPVASLPPAPAIAQTTPAPIEVQATASTPASTNNTQWDSSKRLASPQDNPATIEAPSPIRVTHSRLRVNPLIEEGYNALQQGKLPQAQQAYERMLATEPKNIDALYGLAAIALHRQQPATAEDYYLRILEADPRDALAHAGLAGLNGRAAGGNTESRLKILIAEQPGVAALHFALGNLYAQSQRWRDAQQAYFLAYRNDSETPDVAFNLAVSLDQLHQDKLAAKYYAEALRLADTRPGGFSRDQAQLRLRELQGQ